VKLRLGYHINILAAVALSSVMGAAHTSINATSQQVALLMEITCPRSMG
jgi:hypothetical protein